jgi:hypothetical protein
LFLLPLFRFRHYGRQMACVFFGGLFALHMVMAKPVWHLICRVPLYSGSTGYHRYLLINAAIDHIGQWALFGTSSTVNWGEGMFDITNNYIREGVDGGLLSLLLLIIVLVMAVVISGRFSLRRKDRMEQWLGWAFCVFVLGHCMSFFGVSYFGKMHVLFCWTFAVVAYMAEILRDESGGQLVKTY